MVGVVTLSTSLIAPTSWIACSPDNV